jgi:hypothetical protein
MRARQKAYHMALNVSIEEEKGVDDIVGCDAATGHDVGSSHTHLAQRTGYLYAATLNLRQHFHKASSTPRAFCNTGTIHPKSPLHISHTKHTERHAQYQYRSCPRRDWLRDTFPRAPSPALSGRASCLPPAGSDPSCICMASVGLSQHTLHSYLGSLSLLCCGTASGASRGRTITRAGMWMHACTWAVEV